MEESLGLTEVCGFQFVESSVVSVGEPNASEKPGSWRISTVVGGTIWLVVLDPWKIIPGCSKDLQMAKVYWSMNIYFLKK